MIHFCNHKKQTQNDAYRRSQRQTAHQPKKKQQKNKKTDLYHTLFKTSFEEKKKKKKRMMLATPGLLHCHKRKTLLRYQINMMRHKIFEYSFIASISGIITSVKRIQFSFSSGTEGLFLRTASSLMVT